MSYCTPVQYAASLLMLLLPLSHAESIAVSCGARVEVFEANSNSFGSSESSFSVEQFGPANRVTVFPSAIRSGFVVELAILGGMGKYKFEYSGEVTKVRLVESGIPVYSGAPIATYEGKGGKLRVELESKGDISIKMSDHCIESTPSNDKQTKKHRSQ